MHTRARMGVGTQLRQAREARGLTVRDVAERTKIPSRQIDAIETEHYEKLPGGIFGRGYVRAVAAALKLDANAVVEAYRDETEAERSSGTPMPLPGEPSRPLDPRRVAAAWRAERAEPRIRLAADVAPSRGGPRLLAAVLIGLGVVLLMFWLGRDRSATPLSQAPASSAAPVPPPPRPAADHPIGTAGEGTAATRPAEPPATELLLVAERESWVVLTVDGARVARRTLRPREAVHARMRTRATLMTGDAGALRLSINGGDPQPVGPSGAVRTVEIRPPGR